jgi:FeS assembly SUF system protein
MIQLNLNPPSQTAKTAKPLPEQPPQPLAMPKQHVEETPTPPSATSEAAEPPSQAPASPAPGPQAAEAKTAGQEAAVPGSLEEQVVTVLKDIYDPEIPVNIYELGLIYGVDAPPDGNVKIKMTLTAPNCPAAQSLPAEVKDKSEAVDGVNSADVEVTFDPPWKPELMSDAAKLALNIL